MNRNLRILSIGMALLAGAALSGPAGATLIQYSTLASFQAATTTPVVETFSGIAQPGNYTLVDSTTLNGISYSGGYAFVVDAQYNAVNYDWGTGAVLELNAVGTETLSFATPVTAFGALFGSINPTAFSINASIPGNSNAGAQVTLKTNAYPNWAFFGWTSDTPFSSVTIAGTESSPILDNVTLAVAAVPEPGTYSMMLAGLGLMGFAVRRRLRS
jgi:hypothetical protein